MIDKEVYITLLTKVNNSHEGKGVTHLLRPGKAA